ncbi:MAG: hypothetical protein KGI27_11090 [Thaumarchaeota archaeon]|nr:hypothetical protein [Nitrososphaerota archaeon]
MKPLFVIVALTMITCIIGINTAYGQILPVATENTWFYNYSATWQGNNYSIPAWITNGKITGIKLYPSGEQLNLQITPHGSGIVKIKLPRDIFEHGAVGLADFTNSIPGVLNQTEVSFDCSYHTVKAEFSPTTREIVFDDIMSYYTGPGGPTLHSLAGTTLESIRPANWPIDVESEGRMCGYSFDVNTQTLSLQMRPDLEPDFMQLQLHSDMMGKNLSVYANGLKIPINQHLEDNQQLVILNFTYPANVNQINVTEDKNISPNGHLIYLPLQQSKHGISPFDTICPSGLVIIIKKEDSSAACVFPENKSRLVESGWASRARTAAEIYNSSVPQFGKFFEAGGVMFNVTGASLNFSDADNVTKGGVQVVVNMIAQSLREKPIHVDDSYFALEGIANDNKTVSITGSADNYTRYEIPPDHPVKITFRGNTYLNHAEFGSGWRYTLNMYLKPRNWNDWPDAVVPLDSISCLAGHTSSCVRNNG